MLSRDSRGPLSWVLLLAALGLAGAGCRLETEIRHDWDAEGGNEVRAQAAPLVGDAATASDGADPADDDEEPAPEQAEAFEAQRAGLDEEELPRYWLGTRLYWDLGPRLDTLDGDLSMIFHGRIHLDGAAFKVDDEIEDLFGSPDRGVEFRRAFLGVGGAYRQNLEFNFMVNFAEQFDFRDMFVGVLNIPVVGGVRAGFFKEPFGLEEITSSNDISFVERSLTDAFIERRNLGVMLHRRFTQGRRVNMALGLFRDTDTEFTTKDGYAVTGRVTGLPARSEDGRRLVHLGVSATARLPEDDTVRFRSRPESSQSQVFVDTEEFAARREARLGLEAATVTGPFSLQSEFIITAVRGTDGVRNPVFHSGYVMASYVLTGEHRSYREQVGAFGRIHPERPFPFVGPGAWEALARYSYLDLDSSGIRGGRLHDGTFGLNWYVNHYVRGMFNYIAAHRESFDLQHIFEVRLQVLF